MEDHESLGLGYIVENRKRNVNVKKRRLSCLHQLTSTNYAFLM
jgi:hypothetical protein